MLGDACLAVVEARDNHGLHQELDCILSQIQPDIARVLFNMTETDIQYTIMRVAKMIFMLIFSWMERLTGMSNS